MRIVIIGAGNAGRQLAKRLCDEKHSVVMIDQDARALASAEAGLDILTVCGPGSNPRVLEEAQVGKSDLLIAVTDNDEINILSCLFGHAAGVQGKIARVTNPDFLDTSSGYDLKKMGIDLVINQKQECAREVFNMLQMPGALEAFDLFAGKVMVAGFAINAMSPLLDRTPAECDRLDLIQSVRVIAIRRNNQLVVPHGNTVFMQNDVVYLVGKRADIANFFQWVQPDIEPFEKVIIAGGGDLGLMLAKCIENEVDTVLLEQDEERARFCSTELNKTLILRADALTESALEESGLHDKTAFVALTGDDEGNIMNCLMAQKQGASFTATQITRTDFIPVVESLYLVNRVVSPYISTANAILHWLRSKKVRAASLLHNLPGELLDVVVAANHKVDGMQIKDIKIPSTAIIATVMREGEVVTATGDLQLQAEDRVLIFCHPDAVKKIQSIFL
ncbi:Trk system potassium transporter TrkA [Pontiella agarivorans]|uniref:Trk system potassium uptake protein TrkA n=1 Tax=Pontiella agarivorans TaxID=3038953 RepID=A0ABU5N0F2_9BACT|nr:Trk system potassium transporter TrkA [Pontiella agarivorans]MDZ8119908.1 Trk system potassium transporter TrkA [Pontiella agarivorans]